MREQKTGAECTESRDRPHNFREKEAEMARERQTDRGRNRCPDRPFPIKPHLPAVGSMTSLLSTNDLLILDLLVHERLDLYDHVNFHQSASPHVLPKPLFPLMGPRRHEKQTMAPARPRAFDHTSFQNNTETSARPDYFFFQ